MVLDRISRIRAEASPPTVRKAAIVSEQLGRRYNILYTNIVSGDPASLVQIARWHAGLGTETRAWLDSAEPLTWLKHLLDRRGKRRSEWHVSALIIEEYIKAQKGVTSSTSQPQSPTVSTSFETPSSQHRLKSPVRRISSPPSDSSPGTSLSRVRSSEGHVSFSPLMENSRDSLNNSQMRGEGIARGWRNSIPTFLDSGDVNATPSPYHHRNSSGQLSPASSRLNFPDIIHRFRQHPTESDEGSSSPFGSQSEDQNDSLQGDPHRKNQRRPRSRLSGLHPQETVAENNPSNDTQVVNATVHLPAGYTITPAFPNFPGSERVVLPEGKPPNATSSQSSDKRSYRSTSLPSLPATYSNLLESKGEPDKEGELEAEYDRRLRCVSYVMSDRAASHYSRTLEELKNHNHRLRHRMQRVAVDVREYELLCSNVMPTLGVTYHSLPMELLDALSHDPCAVTGGTRKRHGWRLVEDIHARVLRQREVLASFLSEMKTNFAASISENVLDTPISTLMEKLQALEQEREPLQQQAGEVSRVMTAVRASHSTVKEEFNNALSYTSVVYPEVLLCSLLILTMLTW